MSMREFFDDQDERREEQTPPPAKCEGCGEMVEFDDILGVEMRSHARIETESYLEYEHGCGGDDRICQSRCPVPVEAQRQVQVECGPVSMLPPGSARRGLERNAADDATTSAGRSDA